MHSKSCSGCHQSKPINAFTHDRSSRDGHHHRCLKCDRERTRTRLADKSLNLAAARWRSHHPLAVAAHAAVRHAVKQGLLERQPCAVCGSVHATHAHHDSYHNQLAVVWLCRAHHHEHHRLERLYGPGQLHFSFVEGEA